MKRYVCIFLALIALSLTGCGRKEVYSGAGFEFSYDPAKWELQFELDHGMPAFHHRNFEDVSFAVERYIFEKQFSLAERIERSKEMFGENSLLTWDGGEIVNIDGREWCRTEYIQEVGENKFRYVIYFTYSGIYSYAIGFTSDTGSFDKCMKDFEEIFDSIKITE